MKIDIGCGKDKKKGFIGIDIEKSPEVDYVINLRKENLPFDDNTISEVYSSHFLEHLSIDDIVKVMREIHRVCKDGARVELRVPHFSGRQAFYEFHKTFFRYNSFREFYGNSMFKTDFRFKLIHKRIVFPKGVFFWNYFVESILNWWKFPMLWESTFLRCLFPAFEMMFVFTIIKK